MRIAELIFVGIRGSVVALNRATGAQVWATALKGADFVNVTAEDGRVIVSCSGEVFCLEALTGRALWHNPLKGFGRGLATIATEQSGASSLTPLQAEKRRREQQAAAASTAATAP